VAPQRDRLSSLPGVVLAISLALVLAGCGTGAPVPSASPPLSSVRPGPVVSTTASALSTTAPIAPTPPPLPASLVGTEWSRLPSTQKVVALTFDAGNNDGGVASILATLRATGTPATFFLNGRWVQAYPTDARQIAADGYSIGNHSADLVHFGTLSDSDARQQILEGAQIIKSVTGRDPRPLFRSPFGDLDARTIKIVNSLGYGSIFWTAGTQGYLGTSGGQSVSSVATRVLGSLQPAEIVILEVQVNATDHSMLDADALPTIIRDVRQRGYQFVSLDQFMLSMGPK
jgi:peptidoglycan/xylan/chitin deacetylase (PgdA/CDA1 family)